MGIYISYLFLELRVTTRLDSKLWKLSKMHVYHFQTWPSTPPSIVLHPFYLPILLEDTH